MSYESKMLEQLAMPTRKQVQQVLLQMLFKRGGVIKEFGAGQEIVGEMADEFQLNERQRAAFLETIYRKENRVKKAFLWHRLLFRAADALAQEKMVSRPTQTLELTKKREWMLTEKGFDEALKLCNVPVARKDSLPIKSYEVQKVVKKLVESPKPENYDPVDRSKKTIKTTRESALRDRGFRQAVIEAYNFRCAVCGLKIKSPDSLSWEVEAAHIVPNSSLGRDDIWNGMAMCHLHHWAFDVGWFTLLDNYQVQVSSQVSHLPAEFGKMGNYEFIRSLQDKTAKVYLPERNEIHPHCNAIRWHRQNIFERQKV
jgi:putative restriction endonuclease